MTRVLLAALAGALFATTAAVAAPANPVRAPSGQLAHNVNPRPWFFDTCKATRGEGKRCMRLTVAAIEHARSHEHMRKHALVLPSNYLRLTRAEQTFVIINLERVDRGLRPFEGMVAGLDAVARLAAITEVDPTPTMLLLQTLGIHRYHTVWARDFGVLASDYEWMYNDGYAQYATTNIDCHSAGAPGCWAHRRAILATFDGGSRLFAGTGSATGAGGMDSITAILSGAFGRAPHFVYSWRQAVAHGAAG